MCTNVVIPEGEYMNTKCPKCDKFGAESVVSEKLKPFTYRCKSCGYVYSLKDLYKVKSSKLRRMKELSRNGVLSKFIPFVLDLPVNTMTEEQKQFLQTLKLNEVNKDEVLTDKQKQFIYKWGVLLNISVEYLAPYVPCSYYTCQRELDKYKEEIAKLHGDFNKSKVEVSAKDREFDKMFLNKFIS